MIHIIHDVSGIGKVHGLRLWVGSTWTQEKNCDDSQHQKDDDAEEDPSNLSRIQFCRKIKDNSMGKKSHCR